MGSVDSLKGKVLALRRGKLLYSRLGTLAFVHLLHKCVFLVTNGTRLEGVASCVGATITAGVWTQWIQWTVYARCPRSGVRFQVGLCRRSIPHTDFQPLRIPVCIQVEGPPMSHFSLGQPLGEGWLKAGRLGLCHAAYSSAALILQCPCCHRIVIEFLTDFEAFPSCKHCRSGTLVC